MVRSGQVRSDSNSNSNSNVGPELYTKIGFHHHSPPTTTISKWVFSELCDTLWHFVILKFWVKVIKSNLIVKKSDLSLTLKWLVLVFSWFFIARRRISYWRGWRFWDARVFSIWTELPGETISKTILFIRNSLVLQFTTCSSILKTLLITMMPTRSMGCTISRKGPWWRTPWWMTRDQW